jgi:phosphinothricin acetyltransferase
MPILIRHALDADAQAITDIYNRGIAERGATFETEPRSVDDIRMRLGDLQRFPVLVAADDPAVIGWAGRSSYRWRACYAGIAEFSIYLDAAVARAWRRATVARRTRGRRP